MTMTDEEQTALAYIRAAMADAHVRIEIVPIYLNPRYEECVQVFRRNEKKRWTRVGPMLFPPEGGTTADTLSMLATMRAEALA